MSRFARRSVGFTLTMLALLPMASGCTPEGSGAYKGPYEREVNLAIPAIEKSAGFPFKRMPKVETRSKDDVRGFLERKFDESTPALELAGTERAYKILGLLPDSLDLRKFMLKLLAEQVLGYYDPATKVLYVVEGADKKDGGELVQVTIAHELVHALQDQYANLDSLEKLHGDNDRQTAMQAVMEGQATYEQLASMVGGQSALNMPGSWERVRRVIRAHAEVRGRADQRAAEVVHPRAIGQHAGRERVVFAGDFLGQLGATAAFFKRLAGRVEHLDELARDLRAGVIRHALDENLGIARGAVTHGHRPRRRAGMRRFQLVHLVSKLSDLTVADRAVIEASDAIIAHVDRRTLTVKYLAQLLHRRV